MCGADIRPARLEGVKNEVYSEGTHLMVRSALHLPALLTHHAIRQIPWFETPITFDIRAKPRSIASLTGTKGGVHILRSLTYTHHAPAPPIRSPLNFVTDDPQTCRW